MAAAPEISGLLRGRGRETATCKTLNIIDFRVELSNNKLLELVDVQPPIAGKSTISHRSAIPHGSLSVPLFPSTLFDYLSQWLTNPEQAWPLILVLLLILLILLINTLLSTATTEKKKIKEKNKLYSACLPNINQHEMRKKQRGLLDCANTEKVGVCRQAKETSGKINMR